MAAPAGNAGQWRNAPYGPLLGAPSNEQPHLSILLPITSHGSSTDAVRQGLHTLASSLQPRACGVDNSASDAAAQHASVQPELSFILGIDHGDPLLQAQEQLEAIFRPHGLVKTMVFSAADLAQLPPGPMCWIWNQLADAAIKAFHPTCFVLLGDDVEVTPCGWPALVLQRFSQDVGLIFLLLRDQADPGFPSFPVVSVRHMDIFGRMFPDIFHNQEGDPFLYEVYRRVGATGMCGEVTVTNKHGGVQFAKNSTQPRYTMKVPEHDEILRALDLWSSQAREHLDQHRLSMDVLVPSYRVDEGPLAAIFEAVRSVPADVDARVIVVVDMNTADVPKEKLEWLLVQRERLLDKFKLRFNDSNQGAPATRNVLLGEAKGELLIFLDDDVFPQPGCLQAYAGAFAAHPQAHGFAGPTHLPQSGNLLTAAVHMSDVSFFWEAPSSMAQVPWAVTANMAVRNRPGLPRFDSRFPKTGGGEDVDFALRACHDGMVSVPKALAIHPWWDHGRPNPLRFAKWSWGDGELQDMYPGLSYYTAPNATGTCCASVLLADMLLDVGRNMLVPARYRQHPAPTGHPIRRAAASVIATFIKWCSEVGRLAGQCARGRCMQNLCRRFDWFGGRTSIVVRGEKLKSWVRLAGFAMAVDLCVWHMLPRNLWPAVLAGVGAWLLFGQLCLE